jgi:homospermidine synthase
MSEQMTDTKTLIDFPGRIVFIGFGSIGQGVLPLVLRHVGIPAERVTIVTRRTVGSPRRASTASSSSRSRSHARTSAVSSSRWSAAATSC